MSSAGNPRRYCLLKSQASADRVEWGLQAVWLGKQALIVGTALPVGFPMLTELAVAHYTDAEDLDGADAAELRKRAGLTLAQANAVIAAATAL